MKKFLKKHWVDVLVILAVAVGGVFLALTIADRFNFDKKWGFFYNYFVTNKGYKILLNGVKNTGLITLFGFLIGSLIGTVIAVVRVIPPYKKLTRYAQKVCSIYVAFFRGTPIVVQLLLGYYILLPLIGAHLDPVASCILIFGLNSGAYISEIMRGGIQSVDPGQLEAARAVGLPFPVAMIKIVVPQAALDAADVIIAKGQANAETMLGCGYNVYYAFLVKCIRFQRTFNKPKLTPMLVAERR